MSPAVLSALLLFNEMVTRGAARVIPDVRVFVGVQPGTEDSADYSWTKCIPESGVFVVQVSEKTLKLGQDQVRFAAAHELGHLKLHRDLICSGANANPVMKARRREIEIEADRFATELLADWWP